MTKKSILAGILLASMTLSTVAPLVVTAQTNNVGTIVEQGDVTGKLVEKDGKTFVSVTAKQAIGYISINGVSSSGKSFSVQGNTLAAGETGLYEVTIPEGKILPKTSSVRESIVFEAKAKKETFKITVSYDIERAGVAVSAPVGNIITPEETAKANPTPTQPEVTPAKPETTGLVTENIPAPVNGQTAPSQTTPAPTPLTSTPVVAPFSYGSQQVAPIYQNVAPWSDSWYGSSTLGFVGCVPAALAMAFNAYGNNLSITNVADYLFATGTFNSPTYLGTTQQGMALAAQQFGYKATVLYSKEAIAEALKSGGVVIANVGSLHHGYSTSFVPGGFTHAIVLQGYENGYTTVYNPNVQFGVNTYSLDTVYNERSDDPADSQLGSQFILIHK